MNLAHFDIKESVQEVSQILQEKAEAKNIVIEHDFSSLSLNRVYHDE